ncbi:hypothetical protein RSAG8_13000, partial [Rhizoctonia solani AG-8 WAC10335]
MLLYDSKCPRQAENADWFRNSGWTTRNNGSTTVRTTAYVQTNEPNASERISPNKQVRPYTLDRTLSTTPTT